MTSREIHSFSEHLLRHLSESGQEGSPVFAPFEKPNFTNDPEVRKRMIEQWQLTPRQPGWLRSCSCCLSLPLLS